MDFDSLKDKTIDDELLTKLKTEFAARDERAEAGESKASQARTEAIEWRQKHKALKAQLDASLERHGVSTFEEMEALPPTKGRADEVAKLTAENKRLLRERDEAFGERDDARKTLSVERRDVVIARAVGKQKFNDNDLVSMLAASSAVEQDGEWRFRSDSGKLVSADEFVTAVAKTKTYLVQPAGAGVGGSGYQGGATAQPAKNPFLSGPTFNLTEQIALRKANPSQAQALEAAAKTAAA